MSDLSPDTANSAGSRLALRLRLEDSSPLPHHLQDLASPAIQDPSFPPAIRDPSLPFAIRDDIWSMPQVIEQSMFLFYL